MASTPSDLNDRRVEITGPAEAKMAINALNSGASVFMCCLEDALSPTWANVVAGHAAVRDATRRTLEFTSPEGKQYALGEQLATLVVRPRGWHLDERHVHVDGRPVSASLFDLALYLRWNGRQAVARGSGPYVYLAKLESRHEAELWNDVFVAAQEAVGLPRGTIRATVLIETITASFEMEEILFALREHSAGLNAGRWDYIFSAIKKFRDDPALVLPDRVAVTMAVPFMHAYTEQLVRACHRRGAHAIGGMAAFIPSRDAAVNEQAFARVREDKEREAGQGFDGTWVAHPGLVPLAREIFDAALGDRPNQKARQREDVVPDAAALLSLDRTPGEITLQGVQTNVSVGLRYLDSWLGGVGAAAIDNLMEDAATAEISRAQLWQWIRHGCRTSEGEVVTPRALRARARRGAGAAAGRPAPAPRRRPARARRPRAGHGLRALPDAARRRAAAIADQPDPTTRRMRAYLRFDRRESRLPAAIAISCSAVLYLAPARRSSRSGPRILFPIVAVLGVLPLTIADALGRGIPWQRPLALTLLGLTAAANVTSLGLLVHELIARSTDMSGRELLAGALTVWSSNVIVFALWYWELDRGGPRRREVDGGDTPDFLFPQMTDAKDIMPGWQPAFSDYLYTSSTNATAFSPTDTMPITGRAKLLMSTQSLSSFVLVVLVTARAVNILH